MTISPKTMILAMAGLGAMGVQGASQAAPRAPTYPAPQGRVEMPYPAARPSAEAQRMLDAQIRSLGSNFNGDIGIAVRDLQTGWTSQFDGTTLFPQQSVSKFWVALTALDRADRGELILERPVTVRREDLTLFNQPIARQIRGNAGYTTTLADLMHRAITQSDNTCNDFLMWRAGGPEAVRAFLRDKGISGIRFGPGERLLQSQVAGLQWRQSYSIGNAFYTARAALPADARRAAFERYVADPMDGATPLGIVDALARLKKGELLSPASTRKLLQTMSNTRTGPQRLKGGLVSGWSLAHKTGTGQQLASVTTGYNDIGILTSPDGRSYAVAVMIRRTAAPIPARMAVMQSVVRTVIGYDRSVADYAMAGRYREAPSGSR